MRQPLRPPPSGRVATSPLHRSVWVLGLVSLLMDLSSEMIHSLLPVFMVTTLGATALTLGLIEGIAQSTAALAKVFSGAISDWVGRRKPLVLLGYGLAALSKPLFALAGGPGAVLAARFLDRVGKGIRGTPRDALIADLTPATQRGAAYGLRQALDTLGAVAGPLVALALMTLTQGNVRLVFWVAAVPAALCVLLIVLGVREPGTPRPAVRPRWPLRAERLRELPPGLTWVVVFGAALTLARFSEAFVLLRAESVGISATWVPAVLIVMNIVYAASAYPLGRWSDRGGERMLLALGCGLLVAADLVLAWATGPAAVGVGAALWGLHLGATQGLLSKWVAAAAPEGLRGTAFGVFNLASGVALLIASALAGALWSWVGPAMTFYAGAALAALAMGGLLAQRHGSPTAGSTTDCQRGGNGGG